jgi:hypothetical protein
MHYWEISNTQQGRGPNVDRADAQTRILIKNEFLRKIYKRCFCYVFLSRLVRDR